MAQEQPLMEANREIRLSNSLAKSTSPYLRAHEDNPVAWQQWNSKTIRLAKEQNRLIFLSIGYHACHWCHVMERESFSSPEIAAILNASFIPIKLDREERPDIDEVYMNYITAANGSGGWPLNVFLTPDLEPVFGGTYWPNASPSRSRRTVGVQEEIPLAFPEVLQKMQEVWSTQQERCKQSAEAMTRQLRDFASEGTYTPSDSAGQDGTGDVPEPLDLDLLDDALDVFVTRYDAVHGGFHTATPNHPKFPTPPILAFLLRIGASITSTSTRFGFPSPVPPILGKQSCARAATMALQTLAAMSRSGLRDHLGHGFHRYSVTPDWNLPHFEKMLCDNAQLLGCYCDAWALAHDPEILGTIYSLVEYLTSPDSPIVNPQGGWYTSEDSDSFPIHTHDDMSERKEGAFYVWTLKEFQTILPAGSVSILAAHFGVVSDGNVPATHDVYDEFLSQNVLHIAATPSVLAKKFGLPENEIVGIIKDGRAKLAAYRETHRSKPQVDRKIIAGWNGLAISALVRAANTLADIDETRAQRCADAAIKGLNFIREHMYDEKARQVRRIHSPSKTSELGVGEPTAFVEDYAYLTTAAYVVYDLTFDDEYLHFADQLQQTTNEHFKSKSGAYFQTPHAEEASPPTQGPVPPLIRLKPGTDNALPSPNGIIATNLLYLASYLNKPEYARLAKETIDAFGVEVIQHPNLWVTLLGAVVMDTVGVKTLQIVTAETDLRALAQRKEVRALNGWGRAIRPVSRAETDAAAEMEVMICAKNGTCREIRPADLDEDMDFEMKDEEAQLKES